MKEKQLHKTSLILGISLLLSSYLSAQVDFASGASYTYLKGIDAVDLQDGWYEPGFDDSGWSSAPAPFRYGDGMDGTELTDMQGSYSTIFLRSTFSVSQADQLGEVLFGFDWDDGFILWINGNEVFSQNRPESVSYDALASGLHESGTPEEFRMNAVDLDLVEGENAIAVLACNVTLSESSDFYFDMSIQAKADLPVVIDSVGLAFSHPSGFYSENFELLISTDMEGAGVIYTLDGSNPQTSFTALGGGPSLSIIIDPERISDRTLTPAVVVRASVIKDGFQASLPEARTYIYLENVKTQTHPGGDWPPVNLSNGGLQYMDYAMDPDVVNNAQYSSRMDAALLDLPSISLVTDNANLFDPTVGIYINAEGQGYEWERECSVELINPDASEGFNVNAGLRIRGGWSRHNNYPKHAFRLFFRKDYGDAKLYFPLFEDEGVSRFDKIDLRCAQNYSWANNSSSHHNTYVREVFTRDSQKAAGQPYTRSRYYHLYLNGMYWGIYQTQERSEARYASDYFGGDSEDYDVIKISNIDYSKDIIATDGTLDKWREIYGFTQAGFISNTDYFNLEGKDASGVRIPGAEVYVDMDNLIDFMINIFYSGNYDSPVSAWGGNRNPNNMYAITNREDESQGFRFFIHDGEHTLMTVPSSGPGVGLYENRANIGDITGSDQMQVTSFNRFHSQWLHFKLSKNAEYRLRFANRAWDQLEGNGIFTPDQCEVRFNKRVEQIDLAIIAESARWGDAQSSTPYTKDNAWLPELDVVRNDYFPVRANIVIEQLEDLDLFPGVPAPRLESSGLEIVDPLVPLSAIDDLTLVNPGSSGDIYYTLDGSDPRSIGGSVSGGAVKLASGSMLNISTSSILKSRIILNNKWSATTEVTFLAEQTDFSDLKVTEVHYHPLDSIKGADTISGKSYEFIEFRNVSPDQGINLSGLVIDSAIYYEFPENTVLLPENYFVVAAKPSKFYGRYGVEPSGNFQNSLSNGGEQIVVYHGSGEIIMDFTYDDQAPWPELPDGKGPSLVSAQENPTDDPNDYMYWMASTILHGTPFYHELVAGLDEPDGSDELFGLRVYPNPTNDVIYIQTDRDSDFASELRIYDLRGTIRYRQSFYSEVEVSLSVLGISHGIYLVEVSTPAGKEIRKVIYTP